MFQRRYLLVIYDGIDGCELVGDVLKGYRGEPGWSFRRTEVGEWVRNTGLPKGWGSRRCD